MRLAVSTDISPMEARIQGQLPVGPGWQYEPKWDGFRAVAFRDGDEVVINSRNQRPLTRYFPELVPALKTIEPDRVVLDGEVVIFTEGGMEFETLQLRLHPAASRVERLAREIPASFVAFDVLADHDGDLRQKPLRERRLRLERLLRKAKPPIYLSPVTRDPKVALGWLERYDGAGLDGLVAKRVDETYRAGERAMIKVKQQRTADCVVGGFRWSTGARTVGSLLLGVYRGRTLHYVGHTSGFSEEERRTLVDLLKPLMGGTSFGEGRAPGGPSRWATERTTEWESLRPELVCEVAFDRTINDRFRHGVRFLRWRPDKQPRECTFEQLEANANVSLEELLAPSRRTK